MIFKAFLVFLAVVLCKSGDYHLPNIMAERPLVVGAVVGLFLGDLKAGVIIGAQLELVFLGVVFVGNSTSADACTATGIAVAYNILYGLSENEAISLGVALGYVCLIIANFEPIVGEFFTSITDRYLKEDKQKTFEILLWVFSWIEISIAPFFSFLAVAFGGDLITGILDNTPEFILTGIEVAGAMLPAVGIGMLASLLWDKKTMIYFFFGFFVMKYLGIDILFLAMIAVFIAVTDYLRMSELKGNVITENKTDVEEFFE